MTAYGFQRRGHSHPRRRRAFTLAELAVSIGILVLMFAIAGQVFSLTVRTTGQARAFTETSQLLRAFERTIREDLRAVERDRSVMLIQGNPVNAYWTAAGMEADDDKDSATDGPSTGYPHIRDPEREYHDKDDDGKPLLDDNQVPIPQLPRADILMFFTAGSGRSHVDPRVISNVQQVVYGHAELGEWERKPDASEDEDQYTFHSRTGDEPFFPETDDYPDPEKRARIPAEDWHLARRVVHLLPFDPPEPPDPPGPVCVEPAIIGLDDSRLLAGICDAMGNFPNAFGRLPLPFNYDQQVLSPSIQTNLADAVLQRQLPPVLVGADGSMTKPFARSRLDRTPPPKIAGRMGHYFLDRCASFKVEWSLNPRSDFVAGRLDGMTEIIWLDPGHMAGPKPDERKDDPLNNVVEAVEVMEANDDPLMPRVDSLLSLLIAPFSPADDGPTYRLIDRFRGTELSPDGWYPLAADGRANLVVFTASRGRWDPKTYKPDPFDLVPADIFPSALRITVDVYDRERRLDRPTRHVMVIPVGGS